MHEPSQYDLLRQRRFAPFFWTQFLGAFNDNLFRTALVFIVAYDVAAADPKQAALLASTAAGLFIAPFFLFSGIAGSVADARDKAGITRLVKLSEIAFMSLGWAALAIGSLPLALVGYLGWWLWSAVSGDAFPMPFGPRPGEFLALMFALGLLASWLGTLCWNEASQRLPTTLVGQLIVFETLSALAYAFMLRGTLPEPETLAGIALLVAGVLWALRVRPEPAVVHSA